MHLHRFRKFSLRSLLALPLILAATLGVLRHRYHREIAVVSRLGPTHHFVRVDEPIFTSLGPHVIGYCGWTGPAFLESPMRQSNIPWFDRILRVDILDDSYVSRESLSSISHLRHLEEICVYDRTISKVQYNEVVDGDVTVAFVD